jgi:predicted RNase H-like nuclease (RuvC/YqgF family)
MPFGESSVHGAPSLTLVQRLANTVAFAAFVAAAVLLFAGPGCIVTGTTYGLKAKEADSLREAMASLNRDKGKLAEENAALQKQVAAGKETEAALSARLAEKDESLKRLSEDLAAARQTYEGSRDTREQFIDELLEKEKATGKRLQELSARAERDERELERLMREAAAREPESRERDILAGRVERLQEERREAATRRDERLAALSANLGKLSREVSVSPMGPALRVVVPEKLVVRDRGGGLTELGAELVSQLAAAAADLPSSSLVVITGGKASAETLRNAAVRGKAPEERLFSHVREKEPRAELLLIAP